MISDQQYAEKCIGKVHSLFNSYMGIPKWRFLKRYFHRMKYRKELETAFKACFNEGIAIPEVCAEDGLMYQRLNRIDDTAHLVGLY